ncbi:MAG: TerB family tellurite resistance protein [Candidatus Eremiobacteraeota bacterium]|nr:TerB family tellurite resistance protein [Candidatus Eremiobacteraeota bacterium]MCW5871345.1 TerB family tellurite resistance protein [Candidatus Eremiobacteraeota bacterium]
MSNLSPIQELLVAAAWADGQLAEKEALFLRRVLANGCVSVSQIEACLSAPTVEFEEVLNRLSVGGAGEEVMREVLRILQSDGALHSNEQDLISRLAQHLEFSPEKVEKMRRELSN